MSKPATGLRQALGLAGWLTVSFIAGFIGAVASINAPEFYGELIRPEWGPPASVFGPVWSVLYALMAVAAWLVWQAPAGKARSVAIVLFTVQLVLNSLWSWLFFAWQRGDWALADIVILWALIVAMLLAFWRCNRWSAALIVPYLMWVSFATALNWAVWRLNPELLS